MEGERGVMEGGREGREGGKERGEGRWEGERERERERVCVCVCVHSQVVTPPSTKSPIIYCIFIYISVHSCFLTVFLYVSIFIVEHTAP